MAEKKEKKRSPKDAPLGSGMLDMARQLLMGRKRKIDNTIDAAVNGKRPEQSKKY